MRKLAILAAIVIPVVIIVAFSATSAYATVSPHTGYGASTDFCISCHDVHEAAGDYVLTRKATVTGMCETCHGLFGNSAPASPSWDGNPPADFAGTNPTASTKTAYKVSMAGKSAADMDAVPGHSLGVMLGGTLVRGADTMPGSTMTLKLIDTGSNGLYHGASVTTKNGTAGLYCASCHTPHGDSNSAGLGQMIPNSKLLSSKPNHGLTAITTSGSYPNMPVAFCTACHDKRTSANGNPYHNHPDTACLGCHGDDGSGDFPHTSSNARILKKEPDALCLDCHTAGTLP